MNLFSTGTFDFESGALSAEANRNHTKMFPDGGKMLVEFNEMWQFQFMFALGSSIVVHVCAALIAFVTLRKHKFGRFFSILIVIMGFLLPISSGVVSSATIAFVYRASGMQMSPVYAIIWGVGQTIVSACIGFTRILATL